MLQEANKTGNLLMFVIYLILTMLQIFTLNIEYCFN
jgi:hypothetical protein